MTSAVPASLYPIYRTAVLVQSGKGGPNRGWLEGRTSSAVRAKSIDAANERALAALKIESTV